MSSNQIPKMSIDSSELRAARRSLGIREGDEDALVVYVMRLHKMIEHITEVEPARRGELKAEIDGIKAENKELRQRLAQAESDIGALEGQLNS